ncbi:hypothetical protein L581_0179 [Serratia fonticola AU-AP2C]|nr:hypothetical protein L581_0179 [Serratia fonticola AU-AP2C]
MRVRKETESSAQASQVEAFLFLATFSAFQAHGTCLATA